MMSDKRISKTKVSVLTTYDSPNSSAFVYPILINRKLLAEGGAEFCFYDSIKEIKRGCDAVFINSKFFKKWHLNDENRLYGTLEAFRKIARKIIWFDTNDSTGTTQFNVLPFVDRYCKSQILKDKSLYRKNLYGLRVFTDYYRTLFDIQDNESAEDVEAQKKSVAVLLPEEHGHKLSISWNSAMNEWGSYNYRWGGLATKISAVLFRRHSYAIRFENPKRIRPVGVNGRIGLCHSRATVRHQRELITGILQNTFGVKTEKISRKSYLAELKNSRIGVSPFGLGEISCRDFEVIINGALLYKQDMSHLETWPPLYEDEKTYVSFAWDLSDFEDKLRALLKDDEKIIKISEKAQETYKYYLYGDGRLEFCDKIMDILR